MILTDVNVLVYAHRSDSADHKAYLEWLLGVVGSDQTFGLSEIVLSGLIRIVTHPKIFDPPSALDEVLSFCDELRAQPNCVHIAPGPRHWEIFTRLCTQSGAKGNLVPDAYLAALAVESGSEWISTDRDYSRFPGLRWRHPLH